MAELKQKVLECDALLANLNLKEKEKKKVINKKNVEPIKCDICAYEASSKTVLKRHKTMKHNDEKVTEQTQPPLPCICALEGCTTLVKCYSSESICLACKDKLDQKLRSQQSTLCPCCRKFNSGDPFSFCEDCKS